MLNRKAISRAIRGHLLVCQKYLAYHDHIQKQVRWAVVKKTQQQKNPPMKLVNLPHQNLTELLVNRQMFYQCLPSSLIVVGTVYGDLMAGSIIIESLQNSQVLQDINHKLMAGKDAMKNQLTARLWMQILECITILQTFIKAEWTGNWHLHLKVMHSMLPYLASADHNNYTNSIHQYLYNMESLPKYHPEVYPYFQAGLHVGIWSNRYWAGLSQDLLIEQVLMRSMQTTGGQIRGCGMRETQPLVLLLSGNACSDVNLVMQELTSMNYVTSEQHIDMSRSPFHEKISLCSIVTAVTADPTVNVECAKED